MRSPEIGEDFRSLPRRLEFESAKSLINGFPADKKKELILYLTSEFTTEENEKIILNIAKNISIYEHENLKKSIEINLYRYYGKIASIIIDDLKHTYGGVIVIEGFESILHYKGYTFRIRYYIDWEICVFRNATVLFKNYHYLVEVLVLIKKLIKLIDANNLTRDNIEKL